MCYVGSRLNAVFGLGVARFRGVVRFVGPDSSLTLHAFIGNVCQTHTRVLVRIALQLPHSIQRDRRMPHWPLFLIATTLKE